MLSVHVCSHVALSTLLETLLNEKKAFEKQTQQIVAPKITKTKTVKCRTTQKNSSYLTII